MRMSLPVLALSLSPIFPQAAPALNWVDLPVEFSETKYLTGLDFRDAANGWAYGSPGIFLRTRDGGATWSKEDPPIPGQVESINRGPGGWAYLSLQGQPPGEPSRRAYFYRSSDGGESWAHVETQSAVGPATYSSKAYAFASPSQGISIPRGSGLLATTDSGRTWIVVLHDIKGEQAQFVDSQKGFLVGAGLEGSMGITEDGGRTWRMIRLDSVGRGPHGSLSVHFPTPRTGFVTGYFATSIPYRQYVGKTTDGGATWRALRTGTDSLLTSIHFLDSLRGFAAGWGGLLIQTQDGGETWQTLNTGTTEQIKRLVSAPGGGLYALTNTRVLRIGQETVSIRAHRAHRGPESALFPAGGFLLPDSDGGWRDLRGRRLGREAPFDGRQAPLLRPPSTAH